VAQGIEFMTKGLLVRLHSVKLIQHMQNMFFSVYLFYKVLLTRFGCGEKFNDIFVTNCFSVNFYVA